MTDARYLLSIDPGKSSGIALLSYDDKSVSLVKGWQFGGGTYALAQSLTYWLETGGGFDSISSLAADVLTDNLIVEKFTARNVQGFAYTTDSLEPLRGEGALIALGLMPDYSPQEKRWRDPKLQYLVGGKDKADKKKRLHKFLKDSGFYVAPKDVGCSDADDVRSALGHGLAYLAREEKHIPSHELITNWSEANAVAWEGSAQGAYVPVTRSIA